MAHIINITILAVLCAVSAAEAETSAPTTRGRIPIKPSGGSLVWLGGAHAVHTSTHGTSSNSHSSQESNYTEPISSRQSQIRIRRHIQYNELRNNEDGHNALSYLRVHEDGYHSSHNQTKPHHNHFSSGHDSSEENHHGYHHQTEEDKRTETGKISDKSKNFWVSCDPTKNPRVSCYDCTSRLICSRVGGVLKPCSGQRPYCSGGACSAVPRSGC